MMHFRRILFPIDFSEACTAMAPSVREMAQRFNATVTVLNAFNAVPEYIHRPAGDDEHDPEEGPIPYSPALRELRHERERLLEEFSAAHFSSIGHAERVEDGNPAKVIEWVVKREETDLVMMPTKGLGRFRRFLLGSVTAKVLHDVACPVWTSVHAPGPAPVSPGGYHSIVCAVEMSEEADAVSEWRVSLRRPSAQKYAF